MSTTSSNDNDIAVVGLSCRFPGNAINAQELWKVLVQGEDAWSAVPSDRFNTDGWYHPDPDRPGGFHIKGAHFLKGDIAAFDAPFFSISASEATSMDPQQRLLLEVAYEALESAGIPLDRLKNSPTGVWCGSFVRDYELSCMRDPDSTPPYAATGNGIAILANRLSHAFDLAGTSQTIDTGCSASMICAHEACKSLNTGETSLAIVAGVGLIFSPNTLIPMTGLNILSPDGRCFTFDERANGYGRGEGIGVLILKRVKDAVRDNDTIRAVIRATSSNQDGHTQGITLPSKERQIANIKGVYRAAGLDVNQTAYVECHGTGTQAGDFKELHAVSESLCQTRSEENPLIVGSVKTNIGHLEGSAGVAGLIKGVLTVEKGYIPKHMNFATPNPKISFESLKIKVPAETIQWPVSGLRRASVNSFGFGGTNAHAILDDAAHYLSEAGIKGQHATFLSPDDSAIEHAALKFRRTQLFVFSGQDEAALNRILAAQEDYISKHDIGGQDFRANYAYTLFSRRSKLDLRTFVVAQSQNELQRKLRTSGTVAVNQRTAEIPRIGLVFSGQGAQWHAMGRELLIYKVFRTSLNNASNYLKSSLGSKFCLLDELRRNKEASQINSPHLAQPASTAIQVALVDLLVASGISPVAVVGHSSGEIAAAYAIGAISRENAWKIAYHRGRCAALLGGRSSIKGAMLAVWLSENDVLKYVEQAKPRSVQVACVNGPTMVTLSGDEEQIIKIQSALWADHVRTHMVKVQTAYHSNHMRHIADEYRSSISDITTVSGSSKATMYSSVYGRRITAQELETEYWVQNMILPVQFYKTVSAMANDSSPNTLVEVGPHKVWESILYQILDSTGQRDSVQSCSSLLRRGEDAAMTFLHAMGELWARGCPVNLDWAMTSETGQLPQNLVDLPSYPWDHSRKYWHESHLSKANRFRSHGREDIIGAPLENSPPQEPCWRGFFRISENPWIEQHMIQKSIMYPAGGMLAMAIEAAKQVADSTRPLVGFEVSSFVILKPMLIPSSSHGLENMIRAKLVDDATYDFSIYSKAQDSAWTLHATGRFSVRYGDDEKTVMTTRGEDVTYCRLQYQTMKESFGVESVPRQLYERLDGIGLTYGPLFRNIVKIKRESDHCHSIIQIPDTKAHMPHGYEFDHVIHPATLDSMFQTIFALGEEPMLPTSVESVLVAAGCPRGAGETFRGYSTAKATSPREAIADITMMDSNLENLAVTIRGLKFKALTAMTDGGGFLPNHRNLTSEVVWKEDADTIKSATIPDIVDLMAHKSPIMSILQVGGEDSTVTRIIASLDPKYDMPRFSEYVICGASPEDFAALRTMLNPNYLDRIKYVASEAEAIEGKLYDIVIVPFGTTSSLEHFETVLALGGRVIMTDQSREYLVKSYRLPQEEMRTERMPVSLILPDKVSDEIVNLQHALVESFQELGIKTREIRIRDLALLGVEDLTTPAISLVEAQSPVLFSMGSQDFSNIHPLLSLTKGLVWVTRGGQMAVKDPRYAAFVGLMRTLHSEEPKKNLVSLDIDKDESLLDAVTVRTIVSVFQKVFAVASSERPKEAEYALREGQLFIPRLLPLVKLNLMIEKGSTGRYETKKELLVRRLQPATLDVASLVTADEPLFKDDNLKRSPVKSYFVRLAVTGTRLHPEDAAVIAGEEIGANIGVDVWGYVSEIGCEVEGFQVAEPVMAVFKGTVKSHVDVHPRHVWKVEKGMAPQSFSLTSLYTAIYALQISSNVQADQTVLVMAAASASGQAAIQVARWKGAKVLAACCSVEQREVLLKAGVEDRRILDTSSSGFVSRLMELTRRHGADVVFNATPDHLDLACSCVNEFGRLVQRASRKLQVPSGVVPQNAVVQMFDLRSVLIKQIHVAAQIRQQVTAFMGSDFFKGLHGIRRHNFSELQEAFRSFLKDPLLGMHNLALDKDSEVSFAVESTCSAYINPEATYLLVGGLGGLGRHIALFLARRGAKYIAFFSRSPASEDSNRFISLLEEKGVQARAFSVDICDLAGLTDTLESMKDMPPIKGAVQCAAVLHDATFPNMTFDHWHKSFAPKARGSWNLNMVLPTDMDFFIFLSSSSGIIGNRGQANYAAGNCFQDALARYRSSKGQRSVSLDLGMILGAGMVAKDEKLLDMMRAAGFFGTRLEDFLFILEQAIVAPTSGVDIPSQVVTAVGTGGLTIQNKLSDPFWTRAALFAYLNQVDAPPGATTPGQSSDLRTAAHNAASVNDAARIICPAIMATLAKRKGMVVSDCDQSKTLDSYGIDSMDSIFLLGWISREIGVTVQAVDGITIWALSKQVAQRALNADE